MATKAKIENGKVLRKEFHMYYVTPSGTVMETKLKQYRKRGKK